MPLPQDNAVAVRSGPGAPSHTRAFQPEMLRADAANSADDEGGGLETRLVLFFGSLFAVSFGFSVLILTLTIATGSSTAAEFFAEWSNRVHLVTNLVLLVAALLFRHARLEQRVLEMLDPVLVVMTTALFGAVFARGPSQARPELLVSLATLTICVLRAVVIPSTARRTLLITALAAAPCLAVAWLAHREPEFLNMAGRRLTRTAATLYTGVWWLVQIVVATLTTHVIYGLRERVRAARQLGQYVLQEKLGEGGMGVVYRASHALLRRPTAIKLLATEQVGDNALRRFAREVRLTARLTHPNTVTIYDYGQTPEGIFYYAMELLDGVDLEHLVQKGGPLPASRVRHILVQVGGALAEAHAIGLIHRDVKPANIMICRQIGRFDVAKLLDFGLVRDLKDADPRESMQQSLTGTPLYMAPETIANPEAIDGRADLYGLAAVGYFLLTGVPVFDGNTVMEVCGKHLHSAPVAPSERMGAAVPEGLERALLRCLAKDPSQRYPTAEAFVEALQELTDVAPWTMSEARATAPPSVRKSTPPAGARRANERTGAAGETQTAMNVDLRAR